MSLSPGTRLGSYEIVAAIGSGGMGDVYEARDARLERSVAIKVLPEALARDAERLARFEREAKLLAQLNHPNVATIHGLESDGKRLFLVMELVPGETLRERIARGRMPLDELVVVFGQIADGLEAAHDKGIVHRDLKPANIKLTPEGKVKILDFGLAKLAGVDSEASGAGDSLSPTLTRGTALGTILGTAAYMSPEQAKGKPVDARTDLWAFGCVLFEALTGRRAFEGDDVSETLASVLRDEPPWSALPAGTPESLRRLLRRCLEKKRSHRLAHASDARLELEETDGSAGSVLTTRSRPRREVPAFALGAMVAALLLSGAFVFMKPAPDVAPEHLSMEIPETDTLVAGGLAPVLSPDGSFVVYIASREGRVRRAFVRPLDQDGGRPIEGAKGVLSFPAVSPDGKWLSFLAAGAIRRVPIAGGIPATVVPAQGDGGVRGMTWEDGNSLLFSTGNVLSRVTVSGGEPEVIFEAQPGEEIFDPKALPGGKAVIYTSARPSGVGIGLIRFDRGESRLLVDEGVNPHYVETGHLVFQHRGTVLAAPFDVQRLELNGPPMPLVERVRMRGPSYRGQFSVSRDGTLIYIPAGNESRARLNRLVWVDRDGRVEPASDAEADFSSQPRLSPDEEKIAVTVNRAGESNIWVVDRLRDSFTRLTFERLDVKPLWLPGRNGIIYSSSRRGAGRMDIYAQPVGGKEATRLTSGAYRIATSVSSDGSILLFRQQSTVSTADRDIGMLRLDGASEPVLLLDSEFNEHTAVLSPDDRFMAYVSDESGGEEIFICAFPSLESRAQISTGGGTEPLWSRDGTELFYRNGDEMMAVRVLATAPELEVSRPRVLFEGHFLGGLDLGGNPATNYDVASDGRFLMIQEPEVERTRTSLKIILHWSEELERRVPPGRH